MSTIGSLLLALGQGGPAPYGDIAAQTASTRGRELGNETALLKLAELKRSQATEEQVMQAIKNDPELAKLVLSGGGSSIGSLPTTGGPPGAPGGMPGPGPGPITQSPLGPGGGPTQQIPAYPDASRFANVPPTAGGPIPPDVMGQVTPTVTPPPGTPTLATIGPQGGMAGPPQGPQQGPRNPVLEMARTNPRAAMLLQGQIQAQQDRQWTMQEKRLDWDTKLAGSVARIAQGITDQASLDAARAEIAGFDPRAAAQLPQLFSKEGIEPFIKRAFTAQQSAELRLKTWQNQIEERKNQLEEMKIGVQLTNAGYQGLGEGVTSILRGLSEEQVKQFGGRTTPAAVAYATEQGRKLAGMSDAVKTELAIMKVNPIDAKPEQLAQAQKNIQDRELAKAGEAERLKFVQEQEQQKTLPLQDARKEDSGLWVYKGTGNTLPGTMPYGQAKTLQDEKDPEKAAIKLANLDEKKQLTNLKQLEPVLQQYSELIQYAYGPGGPLEGHTKGPISFASAAFRQALQTDPKLEAMRRGLMGQLQSVVRGLGARGDLNEKELEAANQMIANFDASGGLGLSLGPMLGSGGFGLGGTIKPSLSTPDTPQVGLELANNLIETVNKRIGSIVQYEGYAKTPKITLGTPPSQPAAGTPPATGALPPGAPIPPRTWGVAPTGPQPGQGTPPPASAPGKQSQAQPGRRGIELARASGAKVMDMVDVEQAMEETGKSRAEVLAAARAKGYTVYGAAASSALA